MKKILFYFSMSAMLIFASCESHTVYKQIEKLPDYRMLRDTSFVFEFDNQNPLEVYDVVLMFRYVHGFQFKQAVFNFEYLSPVGDSIDFTFGIPIVGQDGKYIGDGSGDIWDVEHTVISKRALPQGKNTFVITNQMQPDLEYIPNVMAVGLKLVQVK